MSGRDFHIHRRRDKYPRQDSYHEQRTNPNFIEDDSLVGTLERKIQHQNQTINNLIKAFEDSRLEQQRQIQYLEKLKQTEEQKYSIQILEELKTLKQKIKRIEHSPPIIQSSSQMYQQPLFPPLLPQYQQGYPPQQYNYAQIPYAQNPFHQQSQPIQPQFLNNQQSLRPKKPKEMDTLHKFLLQMLHEKEEKKKIDKKPKENSDARYVTDMESSQNYSSKRQTLQTPLKSRSQRRSQKQQDRIDSGASDNSQFNNTKQSQISQQQSLGARSQKSYHQQSQGVGSLKSSQQQSLGVGSQKSSQQKFLINQQRLKYLMRKFRAIARYFWLALTYLNYCKKIWNSKMISFNEYSQEYIGQYDTQFNYLSIISQFYRECTLKKQLDRSWIFTQTLDIQTRCQNMLTALEIFFRYLIVQPLDFTKDHIEFMRKFSLPNGYLLLGHSKYVASRINLRPNNTLNIETPEQSQMLLMEYSFIQILLPQIVEADFWKKLINYKEALKVFVSVLHYLFIDRFYNIPLSKQQLHFNVHLQNTIQERVCSFI
ncbi:unnamed protein product (macronuclear) [Paramecium tetraurelia]|uniref:Uncharacterized protein n=1 Tax=Paramecium tetraurelia TaxID=5888 RepID=A0DJN2_PARTE|nr:uncharacterized protein GSPATT00017593001 [Paramecium tetraurelia]CAK83249.1 unnamed protein product [Paramecium tetraurelia]|eukprot:XP_001450646.1 hypothetical protein (macronuclear) [Paramecium tetraurelia strain d4-2]